MSGFTIGLVGGRWMLPTDRFRTYDCLQVALEHADQVVFEQNDAGAWEARVIPTPAVQGRRPRIRRR